jgi:hypothetical protein
MGHSGSDEVLVVTGQTDGKLKSLLSAHLKCVAGKLRQIETAITEIMLTRACTLEEAIDLLPDELTFFELNSQSGDVVISASGAILHHPMSLEEEGCTLR